MHLLSLSVIFLSFLFNITIYFGVNIFETFFNFASALSLWVIFYEFSCSTLWSQYNLKQIFFEIFFNFALPLVVSLSLWVIFLSFFLTFLDFFGDFFNFASPLMVSIVTGVGGSIVLGALMTTLSQKSWRSYSTPHCA